MIKANFIFMMVFLTLFGISGIVYTQTDSSSSKDKYDTLASPDKRSEMIYRTLNNVGIKYDNIQGKVFKYVAEGEKTEATYICKDFIKEIAEIRSSVEKISYLSKDDLRYMDKSLKRMQQNMEQLIEDIPFMQFERGVVL